MRSTYGCGVELALDLLGGKWRAVIIARIKEEPRRYADLRRLVPRVSEKMLTQRLHELVESGLVVHRRGTYSLSPRGEATRQALQALYDLGLSLAPALGVRIEPS